MLISLSLYSAFAALAEFFIPAFRIVYALQLRIAWITALLICPGAVATQLYLMFETRGGNTRNRMTRKVRLVPAGMIGGAAAFISMNLAAFTGKSFFSPTRAAWIIVLGLLAFVFANLGNKQWRSIINEQIVHVRSSGSQIATLGKNESAR
jgi:peptidoglycan/LPS O-acetylase OafA/YrhL